MAERWLPIPGYEGRYEVSDQGQIKSFRGRNPRILKGGLTGKYYKVGRGYRAIGLTDGETREFFKVSRLVATVFIPNPENKPQVNHKNGVTTDDRAENLEWATAQENVVHAYETGLNKPQPKYLIYCPELNLTLAGTSNVASELRKRGYQNVFHSGVYRAIENGTKYLDLSFHATFLETGEKFGRWEPRGHKRSHCRRGHALTPDNVFYVERDGKKIRGGCLTCRRMMDLAAYHRKKAAQ